ncbi:MAG TPA: hypothetical protein HPQ04_00920 [Rhodospirillaceae bacterium]|nr:hypothetical protein [Rhodospirillaceae bacterium]
MLSLHDCLGFSRLTPEQIEAIADHEHLDMIPAAEWAEWVLDRPNGPVIVQCLLTDQLEHCRAHGDIRRSHRYQSGLDDFIRRQSDDG